MKKHCLFFSFLVLQILITISITAQNKTFSIPLAANDIIFDTLRNVIYATVKTEDSYNLGNRIVAIDPSTGKISKNIFVGSQPTRMALTDGNTYLYVSLGGSPRIIRIQLDRFEVDMDFTTTSSKQQTFYYPHDDIAVFPQKTDYVISTLSEQIGTPNWGFGVSVLQNGKQIEVSSNGTNPFLDLIVDKSRNIMGITAGVFMSSLAVDSNIIVATEGYGAVIMMRTPNNTIMPVGYYKGQSPIYLAGANYARIAMDNRIIYTSAGKIVRLKENFQLEEITTLPNVANPHRPFSFFIDKATNGIYFANTEGSNIKVKKFNKTTYALEAEWTQTAVLPNGTNTPFRFVKLNGTQVALMVQGTDVQDVTQYRLMVFNLNNTATTLVNVGKEGISATERVTNATYLPIAADAIVLDSIKKLYYVAVKPGDANHPKSIVALNALTFAIEKKITFPGNVNGPFVLSKDSKYLYFQQVQTHKINRLDLDTWTVGASYDLGNHPVAGRFYFLIDAANVSDVQTSLALLIGDDYYASLAPKICLFDTSLNLIKTYRMDKQAIESSTDGKTIFSMDTYTTASSIRPLFVNNQTLTISPNDYQKVLAGPVEHKLFNNKIYNSGKFATRVTDTVCFIDGFYPYSDKDVFRKSVTPTNKSIFLTQLLKEDESNVSIRSVLPTKEFLYLTEMDGGPIRLRVLNLDGQEHYVTPMEPVRSIGSVLPVDGDDVVMRVSSYTEASAWYRFFRLRRHAAVLATASLRLSPRSDERRADRCRR